MGCRRCGFAFESGSKFCGSCGAPVPPPARWGRAALIGGGVTVALAATVGIVTVATRGDGGKNSDRKQAGAKPTVGRAVTANLPPQVTSFTARAPRVAIGGSTELVAAIADPEGDPYFAWWTSTCGVIAPRSDEPGRALFLAPAEPGACRVTMEVQDHELRRPRRLEYTIVVTSAESGG